MSNIALCTECGNEVAEDCITNGCRKCREKSLSDFLERMDEDMKLELSPEEYQKFFDDLKGKD